MLRIHNTLTRQKQEFVPTTPGQVRMYVCGMTVYDYCHLGHARFMIVFDLVQRWLRALGYQVTYVRNITDIDDKIIKRAQENNEPVEQLTARFIQAMNEDAVALGVEPPAFEPRATQYVPGMQEMIRQLEGRGLAYSARSGDINYSVRKFPGYGKLSGKSLDELRAGERVEVDAAKQDPLDFVLWKRAKDGEPYWDSPWGKGRPGWHIECSVMSSALLGQPFDIHGGGQDLQFPHHENEIAQSEGAAQKPFVNYWMHNGFVRVDNEKMSKSLGNFFTIRDVLAFLAEKYFGDREKAAEVVRFFIARAHYRSSLNYSDQHLDDAKQALTRLYTALREVQLLLRARGSEVSTIEIDWKDEAAAEFRTAMDDDFNTPEAVAVLFKVASDIQRLRSELVHGLATVDKDRDSLWKNLVHSASLLRQLGGILGLLQRDPNDFLQGRRDVVVNLSGVSARGEVGTVSVITMSEDEIKQKIDLRTDARRAKNFKEADRIRKELLDAGVVLEDTAQGTTWRRS